MICTQERGQRLYAVHKVVYSAMAREVSQLVSQIVRAHDNNVQQCRVELRSQLGYFSLYCKGIYSQNEHNKEIENFPIQLHFASNSCLLFNPQNFSYYNLISKFYLFLISIGNRLIRVLFPFWWRKSYLNSSKTYKYI